ncbi:MAG: aspartyl protease family protein [Saprospiraceae bacterium]|nr:aspartyl protease family protein [Saprospiraceae bacterium]
MMFKNIPYGISRKYMFISFLYLFFCPFLCKSEQFPINLLGNSSEVVIPFSYHQGFIVVDLVFQKLIPLKFILDTGAENTILLKKEYAEMMQITYHKKINILGSDMSQTVQAYICNGTFLQLVNTQTIRQNIIVLEKDHLFLEEYIGTKIDGILGAEFFRGLVMKIDYNSSQVTLSDPAKYNYSKLDRYHSYDIDIVDSKPYLNCITEVKPGHPTKTKLLIDTGAGLTALFHNNTDSLLSLPVQIVKGSLGKGLGGDIEGYAGKIHSLKFGTLEFNNLISSFQALDDAMLSPEKIIRNGLVGNLLLERFVVIIDLLRSKLYLKPNKNYNKDFEFDKSGMTIFAFGEDLNQYYVKYVIDNSPAMEADIRPGDIILKVGFWSRRWLSLMQINRKLIGKNGKKVRLKIKRNNEVFTKTIILRDIFEIASKQN